MNPLYAMFIYPLELVYHFIYSLCYTITGNYGVGLIVLSCLAAIGYLPLGRLAVKAQHKEKQLSALLKPKLDKIKVEETDGSKRQLRTSNLYKKYRYHPFLAIRSAFGVILQLPFLLGAYYMISNFTALEGQSFLFISDLSKPDGLLGGVNFLPFLMTAINICTTLITPKLSIKDRTQAFIIAGGFLWLLYSAPSALLFFWTTNNLIFFVQNLIVRVKAKNNESTTPPFKLTLSRWNQAILATTAIYGLYTTLIYIKIYMEGKVIKPFILNLTSEFILAYISICITLWAVWKIIIQTKEHNKIFFASIKIASVLMLWTPSLYFFRYLVKNDKLLFMGAINYGLYTLIFLTNFFIILISIDTKKITAFFDTIFPKKTHKPFFTSLAILFILFFFYHVAMFYKSDASYFTESLFTAYSKIFPIALVCFGCITLIYYFLNQYWKYIITSTVIFSLFLSLLNLFIFKGNYGALDLNLLSNPVFFTLNQFAMDMLAFFMASTTLVLLYKYKMIEKYNNAALLFLVTTIVITAFASIPQKKTTQTTEIATDEQTDNLLEQYYGLSKTEPNVIIFIFDMFTGGHMEELLERNPNFWNDLDGFTWYPDTLSFGRGTVLSLAGIYGGYKYDPSKINERKKLLLNEINIAFTELPQKFTSIKSRVSLNKPVYFNNDDDFFYKKINNPENILFFNPDTSRSDFYKNYKIKDSLKSDLIPYFLVTSIFKLLPHFFRYYLYDNGRWQRLIENANIKENTLNNITNIKMFTEFASINSNQPTLKIHYNDLSHSPWYLKEGILEIIDDPNYDNFFVKKENINGIRPAHHYTEEHIIVMITEYIQKLKELGVYNNTRIIMTSDHDQADSIMLQRSLGGIVNEKINWWGHGGQVFPGMPHGLLLFKDFNMKGKLEISDELMTPADTYYLAQKDIFFDVKDTDKSTRYHYDGSFHRPEHLENKFLYKKYAIEGTMFKKENWKFVDEVK
ncbi:MAG: YidC/Oxa1 family membrane protein insertase [Treponemataceae bacterium]